jgi:hypothetical protein
MQDTKRIAEGAKRMGQEAQEGRQSGFEAASGSFRKQTKGSRPLLPR